MRPCALVFLLGLTAVLAPFLTVLFRYGADEDAIIRFLTESPMHTLFMTRAQVLGGVLLMLASQALPR